ncbi:MAG: outer membrane protein transport protein [Bacteroidales bacterium]|nr:outer membrane protein transport protein [Bacteroidales bacterium]
MKKLSFYLGLCLVIIGYTGIYAQNLDDAVRYSYLMPYGDSRFNAVSGAFSGIGANITGISLNPAGLGVYKKSEISGSFSISNFLSNSKYLNNSNDDIKTVVSLPSMGLVISSNFNTDKHDWKNLNFGLSYSKLADFNSRIMISADNPYSSIVDVYSVYANGFLPNQLNVFDTWLAFDTWLLDTIPGTPTAYEGIVTRGVRQDYLEINSGSMYEINLAIAGNYDDKLYIGGSINFPIFSFERESTYSEEDVKDTIPDFKSLEVFDYLNTDGEGLNFKIGFMYKPIQWFRFSLAFLGPSYFWLHDSYFRTMRTNVYNGIYTADSPRGEFNYRYYNPMRAIIGLGFIFGENGFINAEYEWTDYTQNHFSTKKANTTFFDLNNSINNELTYGHNIRVGTEWVLKPFAMRAGYAYYSSPYKNISNFDTHVIGLGFGYRENILIFDVGINYYLHNDQRYLYDPLVMEILNKPEPKANLSMNNILVSFTIGMKL